MDTIRKRSKTPWSMYLAVLFIIFMTDTSYVSINANSAIVSAARIAVIFVSVGCTLWEFILHRKRVRNTVLFLSFSVFCTIFLTGALFGISYYVFIAELWLCYYLTRKYSINEFAHCYLNVMRVIALGSIICWLFPQFFVNVSFFPQFTSSVGAVYRFLGVATIPFKTHMQRRNFGPFWEPGTYQVYLCIAIFLLLFVEKKKWKTLDLLLFMVAELTTMSGASLLPAGLMMAAYLLKERRMRSFIAVLIGSIVIIVMMDTGLFDGILLKMTGQDSNSSFMIRWIGLEGGIRAFLKHPIFGSPYAEIQQIKNELGLRYLGTYYGSNTGTFMNYYAYYGLYVGCFFLVSSYKFFKTTCGTTSVAMIAFAAYFLSTSNENMIGSLLIIAIAFLGFNVQSQADRRRQGEYV